MNTASAEDIARAITALASTGYFRITHIFCFKELLSLVPLTLFSLVESILFIVENHSSNRRGQPQQQKQNARRNARGIKGNLKICVILSTL